MIVDGYYLLLESNSDFWYDDHFLVFDHHVHLACNYVDHYYIVDYHFDVPTDNGYFTYSHHEIENYTSLDYLGMTESVVPWQLIC